ncbi:excalibur calcium-binding domain-containing protein [Sporosarcina aquimarina]|uniref:Excalibur calcium-binding domain-containing protein n=1 Tax=Sporosarcina aquimarina TaxID=114975 RepID=A0ABU4FXH0_9BACL|nr:excalibur calcium-binding domain-containing protein [Sporosarcina aquimarina]MDW0108820.1 excalibur calcium-binding domain-containing protein [Sporosarcina aquimarina]
MKKFTAILSATVLALGVAAIPAQPADAAPAKFKNCKMLNQTYKGGVAMNSKVRNKGGKTKYAPTVNPTIYKTHTTLDRDKDGIACER